MSFIAGPLYRFERTDALARDVGSDRSPDDLGAAYLRPASLAIGVTKRVLIQHDLDGVHMWNILHSQIHNNTQRPAVRPLHAS